MYVTTHTLFFIKKKNIEAQVVSKFKNKLRILSRLNSVTLRTLWKNLHDCVTPTVTPRRFPVETTFFFQH